MCDGFNHGALQIAVAQICQSMGWDALQKSTHDLLTDVLQKYLEEIAKSAHGYCQLYSRSEPNLDDLNQAFQDVGVCLNELEDFVSQVDQVPFIHQLPRFPKPKPCALHHPHNGEITERLEQYYDYLPPLISKLLQNEDEEKAAAEDGESADTEKDQGTTEEFVRNEIKTVAEETCNESVTVKRVHDDPAVLESDPKKRRVDLPFLQKGNRGNEMDILDALQGNLSSPSPTPSPDIWNAAKTFEIPPTSGTPQVTANQPTEKVAPTKSAVKKHQKTETVSEKAPVKQANGKPKSSPKSSPKKKVKAPKNTNSPVVKSASPTVPTSSEPTKEKAPSPMKSPPAKKKKIATSEVEAKKKTPSKKDKKVADKVPKPVLKSPPESTTPVSVKENIQVKETMPKLIIKPIKKEANKEPQFAFSEFMPPDKVAKQENSQQKKSKSKVGISKKKKPKKEKQGTLPLFKTESSEERAPSTSEGLKFSIAGFVAAPPVGVLGDISVDPTLEHKKKKKKRKEKDKDKEKKKDKSKKLKTDHGEPFKTSSLATPPIPRITVKLDPPSQSSLLTSKAASKAEPSAVVLGTAGNQAAGSSLPVSPKLFVKQESSVPSAAPKLTIKSELLERTVVSQTVSTTVVHGYSKEYYCPVCGDPDDGSFMIGCDGCDEWFHGRCVGILEDPGNVDWFCSSCLAKKDKDSKEKPKKKKRKKNKEKEK